MKIVFLLLFIYLNCSSGVTLRDAWQDGAVRRHDHVDTRLAKLCVAIQDHMESSIVNLTSRHDLARVANTEKMAVGAELGVQSGAFSQWNLQNWPSNRQYYMIDLWSTQKNYSDVANVDQARHDEYYARALDATAAWKEKRLVKKMSTVEAVEHIPDESIDFLYVDARHDFCSVQEDVELYWSKVKPGGIVAGHDYYTAAEVPDPKQDWSVCANGTLHPGAVKGAVDAFFTGRGIRVFKTGEHEWYSWVVRKPLSGC